MTQFGGKDHLARCSSEDSYPGGLAARIELNPQWLDLWGSDGTVEHDRERVAPPNGCSSPLEQQARMPRMDRVKRLLVRIEYKDF
jgi:hypothetical protein